MKKTPDNPEIEQELTNYRVRGIVERNLVPSSQFIYGFAGINGLLGKEFERYPFGISIGRRLDDDIVDAIKQGPTLDYYEHYRNINFELGTIAANICRELEINQISCIQIAPTFSLSDKEFKPYLKNLRYKVSHKMIATRAGLGWIGKTDLFVSRAFGPRVRLTSILVNKPLELLQQPVDKSQCGKCKICVEKCPAQAATGDPWDISTDRDRFFNARKCYEKCGEQGKLLLHPGIRICGICVSVCPLGKTL
jgi:epoxyqueuosine reductase QueG